MPDQCGAGPAKSDTTDLRESNSPTPIRPSRSLVAITCPLGDYLDPDDAMEGRPMGDGFDDDEEMEGQFGVAVLDGNGRSDFFLNGNHDEGTKLPLAICGMEEALEESSFPATLEVNQDDRMSDNEVVSVRREEEDDDQGSRCDSVVGEIMRASSLLGSCDADRVVPKLFPYLAFRISQMTTC